MDFKIWRRRVIVFNQNWFQMQKIQAITDGSSLSYTKQLQPLPGPIN